MSKAELLQLIIDQLNHSLDLFFTAARTTHEAAKHAENIADNKYDTLALETSYLAQGQANRASELRQTIAVYKQLQLITLVDEPIRLTALVTLTAPDGTVRVIFIGPLEGGLKVILDCTEVVVITPGSPLGKALLGKAVGDTVEVGRGASRISYEISEVN